MDLSEERLQILTGLGLAWLGTSLLWLLVKKGEFPRISHPDYPVTDFFGSFCDTWVVVCGHLDNIRQEIRHIFDPAGITPWHLTPYFLYEPETLENIVLAVFAAACYGGGFALIRRHQDSISRLWSLRFAMGLLVAVNAQFLAKILWNRYAPA